MPLSTRLFETGKLLSYIPRRISLEHIGNQGRTEARRRAHKDMDVIFIRFYREQRQPLSFATFSDQSPGFRLDVPHQSPGVGTWESTRGEKQSSSGYTSFYPLVSYLPYW